MSEALAGQIALSFFFLFFLGVIAWAWWPSRAGRLRRDAGLPLDEGRPVSRDPGARADAPAATERSDD